MTTKELQEIVHKTFYEVVRIWNPPPIAEFLNKTFVDTWPTVDEGQQERHLKGLIVWVQAGVADKYDMFINSLEPSFFKNNADLKWEKIIDKMGEKAVGIPRF